jgi:D-lactate dehydrogenase
MLDFRDRFEHHLLIRTAGPGTNEAEQYFDKKFPSSTGDYFKCTPAEATKAFLHRFVVAGAAVRYRAIHTRDVQDIVALDFALRRNDLHWYAPVPPELGHSCRLNVMYGHFFCHVFHQDLCVSRGVDVADIKAHMHRWLIARRAEFPAEHNVGHLYKATPGLESFYRALDLANRFNPGIGGTSTRKNWK